MGTVTEAINQDLDELKAKAITSLNRASEDLVTWCDAVRDPHMPWAFRWSKDAIRGANVGACNYILQAASWCGVEDRILTPEQQKQGAEWIRSLKVGNNVFTDPALVDRKPPDWDAAAENWPLDGAHKEAINQYARGCLRFYENAPLDQLMGPTPPTWPQKGDTDIPQEFEIEALIASADSDDPGKPGRGGPFEKCPDGWYYDPPATEAYDPRTAVGRWPPAF